MIHKVPKTHRYQLGPHGTAVINALLTARQASTSTLAARKSSPEEKTKKDSSTDQRQGKPFFTRPGETAPFFLAPLPNPHGLAVQPGFKRMIMATTNANSNGNGRPLDKKYPGNFSPLHVYDLP